MGVKYKRIFDKKVDRYGQTATLHQVNQGILCPCMNTDSGWGDPLWHIQNPTAPQCNEEGLLSSTHIEVSLKAFIIPATDAYKKGLEEILLTTMGKLQRDDYVYIGKSDIDIFNLKETDYLAYNYRKWKIKNPDVYKIGDVDFAYVARLELLGDTEVV